MTARIAASGRVTVSERKSSMAVMYRSLGGPMVARRQESRRRAEDQAVACAFPLVSCDRLGAWLVVCNMGSTLEADAPAVP